MNKLWYLKHAETVVGETCGDALSAMAERGVLRTFGAGETIFTPFDQQKGSVYLLRRGRVTIYESIEGRTFVLDVLCPGDLFGDFRPFSSTTPLSPTFARADRESRVLVLPREDFLLLLKKDPELSLCLVQLLSERLQARESRLRDLALADADRRILNDLLREGVRQEDGTVFVVRKTHELIGQRLGLSRETVTKSLGRLQERGHVAVDHSRNFVIYEE